MVFILSFFPHYCTIKSRATDEVLWGIVGTDGLYSFPNLKIQDCSCQAMSMIPQFYTTTSGSVVNPDSVLSNIFDSSNLWHVGSGHSNANVC